MGEFIEVSNNTEKFLVNVDHIVSIRESSLDENHSVILTTGGYEFLVNGKYNHVVNSSFKRTKALRAFETVISQTNMDSDTYSRCLEKFTNIIDRSTE